MLKMLLLLLMISCWQQKRDLGAPLYFHDRGRFRLRSIYKIDIVADYTPSQLPRVAKPHPRLPGQSVQTHVHAVNIVETRLSAVK